MFKQIIVIIILLGVIAVLVVPKVMTRPDAIQITQVKQDIFTINASLKLYHHDNGTYPTTEQGLAALVDKPTHQPIPPHWKGPYLETLPQDPWGNSYQYTYFDKDQFEIISFGARK